MAQMEPAKPRQTARKQDNFSNEFFDIRDQILLCWPCPTSFAKVACPLLKFYCRPQMSTPRWTLTSPTATRNNRKGLSPWQFVASIAKGPTVLML